MKSSNSAMRIPFWSQLRWNLIFIFILLALIPAAIVLFVSITRTRAQATSQIVSQLESVSILKQGQIKQWLGNVQNSLAQIVVEPETRERFLRFSEMPPEEPAFAREQQSISELLSRVTEANPLFEEIFFYTREGLVIAASNPVQIGKRVAIQPYYTESLVGDYIQPPFYAVGSADLVMFVTHPLHGAASEQAAGVLAGRLDINALADIMLQRSGLGESGDTYLVSQESNYLLTPSRFEDQGYVLGRAYHSEGIEKALNRERGSGVYGNYRNPSAPVFGVYDWVPELNAGILAEIDVAEGLAAYEEAQRISILVAVLSAFLAAAVGLVTANRISFPITTLTNAAVRIAGGNLDQPIAVAGRNEIGMLAQAFDSMTQQLRNLIGTLEQRVADRTKALAASAEVSRRLSSVLDQQELIHEVVEQVRSAFNYYHVHIYLYDPKREYLVMAGGTGEAARAMLAKGHRLEEGRGLVGRAAGANAPVLVPDVSADPGWLPNPLLPETRAEAAVPIAMGGHVLGVLDVQHNVKDGLKQEDVELLQSIAFQVAIGLQNARSYEQAQRRADHETLINTVTQRIQNAGDIESVLQIAARELGQALGAQRATIQVGAPKPTGTRRL